MNKFRLQFMATLVAGLVLVLAAVARGSDGDPLILGSSNDSVSLTDWDVSLAEFYGLRIHSDGGPTPLRVVAADGSTDAAISAYGQGLAIEAQGPVALRASGKVVLDDRSGKAIVPAGSTKVTVQAIGSTGQAITAATLVIATVQQSAGGAMVKSAIPRPAHGRFTINLNKAATVKTTVAWVLIN